MKKYVFIIIVFLAFSCKHSEKTVYHEGDITNIEFQNTTFDFESIIQGETVTYTFNFTNTGQKPLIINNVKSSCGCTVPDYSNEPLAAGEKGYIKVTFNSSGKNGSQYKIVTVTTNTDPENTELIIKGNVTIPNN